MTDTPTIAERDVAQIAAGLTKRSKRALPLIGEDWTDESYDKGYPCPVDTYSLQWGRDFGKSLVDLRLREGTGAPGRSAQWQWRLTPLGLAVRAHLKSQEPTS